MGQYVRHWDAPGWCPVVFQGTTQGMATAVRYSRFTISHASLIKNLLHHSLSYAFLNHLHLKAPHYLPCLLRCVPTPISMQHQ